MTNWTAIESSEILDSECNIYDNKFTHPSIYYRDMVDDDDDYHVLCLMKISLDI